MMNIRISRPTYIFSKATPEELIGIQEAAHELGITIPGLRSLINTRRLDVVEDMERIDSTRNRSYLYRADFEKLKAERRV